MVRPDDLPQHVSKETADLAELLEVFKGWDERLRSLLSRVDKVVKWKIWGMEELDTWTRVSSLVKLEYNLRPIHTHSHKQQGCVALLGDACHPSTPYAASGAAMAVEDGAVLGKLIGLFGTKYSKHHKESEIPQLLQLYQALRKSRCRNVVQLADDNGRFYHMPDGPEQQKRDQLLVKHDWWDENAAFPWRFADFRSLRDVYGRDVVREAEEGWKSSRFGGAEDGESGS